MDKYEKYDKLIELLTKFNNDTDCSMTHIKRGTRITREFAESNFALAKLFSENYVFLPQHEYEKIRDLSTKMQSITEEFAEFFRDYGEDLTKIGNGMSNIFSEFNVYIKKIEENENADSVVE